MREIRSIRNNKDAFIGLESAVFSYGVMGTGFFTTQKSQKTVHTAVGQASSAVKISGNVYGEEEEATGKVVTIKFVLGLSAAASPVDLDKTVMTFSNVTSVVTLNHTAGYTADATPGSHEWIINKVDNGNGVLEPGEQFTIIVEPSRSINAYEFFTLDIKPAVGASRGIHRTISAPISKVNLLY